MKTSEQILAEVSTLMQMAGDPKYKENRRAQGAIGFACNALLWVMDDGNRDQAVSAVISADTN